MINSFKMSLKIDMTYAINSFIYSLRKLPIFRDLLTEDAYKSRVLKLIARVLGILFSTLRVLFTKGFYFYIIFLISSFICPTNKVSSFIHVYFLFTIIGMFINNRLLNTSTKKYFSIILFNMDAKKYLYSDLVFNIISNLILNSIAFYVLSFYLNIGFNASILLIISSVLFRIVGEVLNIKFYKKYNYIWYNNYSIYFPLLIVLLLLSLLPFLRVFVNSTIVGCFDIFLFVLIIPAIYYLIKLDDLKLIYKRINTLKKVMNGQEQKVYSRQEMVSIKDKDIQIDSKKLEGKNGYDLFNTIFFERHKEILSRSSKNYSLIIIGIYAVIIFLCLTGQINNNINKFLLQNLGWFVLIMYFINRGAIITQAMFFNCDHAMLSYNFYREPDVLLGLFKRRVLTVTKVNLLPAIIIGIGNIILLFITGGTSLITYISSFIYILLLSVFFSVHYLALYYLLQPYNKDMEIKKVSYSVLTLVTYIVAFQCKDLVVSSLTLSIIFIICTIIYLIVSLKLVEKYAPKTFKIN